MRTTFRALLFAAVGTVAFSAPALAQTTFDQGVAAYDRGDFAAALATFRSLAEQGDPVAQYNLGIMYDRGTGVPENDAEALKWYRLAADQNYSSAELNLGLLHYEGRGVPRNLDEAVKWYRRAADKGVAEALFNLGAMYANGEGVPRSYVDSYKWLTLSINRGNAAAGELRDLVGNMLTQAEIAEGERLAAEWMPAPLPVRPQGSIADGENAYSQGDLAAALRIWRPLAEQGDAIAQSALGVMYDNGEGVPENDVEAVRWYRLAAEQGSPAARFNLALMYDDGTGDARSVAEAVHWYRLAAEQGVAEAQFNLGSKYFNGEGVPQNTVEAYKWITLAGQRGVRVATNSLELLRSKMTPAQIAEGDKKVAAWKPADAAPAAGPTATGPQTSTADVSPAPRAGETFRDCADCPQMVAIPAGQFMMGSPATEDGHYGDEGQRQVTVPAFAAGMYEVTYEQYDACVSAGACAEVQDAGSGRGARPVAYVSWNEAVAYAGWLSVKTGKTYRLLSEAEWEYAARAGTTTPFSTGATISPAQANYNATNGYAGGPTGEWRRLTLPVGSFPPNAFGLYDMHGNVAEWVEDAYNDSLYNAPVDGSAYTLGGERVFRGGSWEQGPHVARSAHRASTYPTDRGKILGFRLARVP